jgi:hypothetical protein
LEITSVDDMNEELRLLKQQLEEAQELLAQRTDELRLERERNRLLLETRRCAYCERLLYGD